VDPTGDSTTTLSAAVVAPEACLTGRVVTFDVSADGSEWSRVGTASPSATGSARVTWTHASTLSGVWQVRVSTKSRDACPSVTATGYIALARAGDAGDGAGRVSSGRPIRFAFRISETGTPSGQLAWSDGEARLTSTELTGYRSVPCPAGFTTCAVVTGTAAVERLAGDAWTPEGTSPFTATLFDGIDGDAFGLRVEGATRPAASNLSAGSITLTKA
jgi:hypothetical protein